LQAWRRGIPVISYLDPDEAIQSNQLGKVVRSEDDLYLALSEILSDDSWEPDRIRNYFVEHHSSKTIDKYTLIFKDIFPSNHSCSVPA
jgi:uncharacterized protein YqfB (UPF0267 family)